MSEQKYNVVRSKSFKKGYKLAKKQGLDLKALAWGINQLAQDIPLPDNWKDHSLKGNFAGLRECHIGGSGDWLLVYEKRKTDMILYLVGTGNHNETLGL